MENKKNGSIYKTLNLREEFFGLAVAAIVLSFGINLATGFLQQYFSDTSRILIAILAVLGPIMYWSQRLYLSSRFSSKIVAALFYEIPNLNPIGILRYKYSRDAQQYLKSIFSENVPFKKQWTLEVGPESFKYDKENSSVKVVPPKILKEFTEFLILEILSSHLSSYFDPMPSTARPDLTILSRNDISNLLVTNRVLDQVSKSPKDRAAFENFKASDNWSNTYFAHGKDGVVYSRVELQLPKNATIQRSAKYSDTIEIFHPDFKLTFKVKDCVTSVDTPYQFEKLYLKSDIDKIKTRRVEIHFEGQSTLRGLFKSGQWDHLLWIDSFLSSIHRELDFNEFLKEIDFEAAVTARLLQANSNDEISLQNVDSTGRSKSINRKPTSKSNKH